METIEKQYRNLPNFDDSLRAAEQGGPITPPVAEKLEEMLPSSSESAGYQYRRQKFAELHDARGTVEHLKRDRGTYEDLLAAVDVRLGEYGEAVWGTGVLFLLAFAACYGAEFIFNRAILPWLLGVDPNAILGLALAAAPATAPVILDRILARLLHIADPLANVVEAVSPGTRARAIARNIFLGVAAVLTLYSVWILADARAIASAIMTGGDAVGPTEAQRHLLDLALLLVSVVLTVNGALFYLFGAHEVRLAWARLRTRREAERIRGLLRENSSALAKAEAALADAQHTWEMIDDLEKGVVANFNHEGRVKLAQAMSKPGPALSASEMVREKLQRRAMAA